MTTLSPSQNDACVWLTRALPVGSIFRFWGGLGRGKTTVLRRAHQETGGAFISMKERSEERSMRPKTLAAVARMTLEGELFGRCLANFLDDFYSRPREEALVPEPEFLSGAANDGAVWDAYLAATEEELAQKFDLRLPAWTRGEGRALRRPWFASDLQSMRAVLLVESPAGFRSRNLFVSENALSRA